jgi:hypothetical protein
MGSFHFPDKNIKVSEMESLFKTTEVEHVRQMFQKKLNIF